MAFFEYNPIASYVSIKFKCPKCGKTIETDAFSVPAPDFSAESHSSSINSDYYEVECDECGESYDLTLGTGIYGGEGDLDEVEDILEVNEHFPKEDDEYLEKEYYNATHTEVEKALDAIDSLPEENKKFLYKQLFAAIITSLETYLADTLKRYVLADEEHIRKFVETYHPFKTQHISLSKLFSSKESLPKYIRNVLDGLMYHNLPKIKPIYKDALDVDLGEIKGICRAIRVRHDIVHRNGKDLEGNEHTITKQDVLDLSKEIKDLIDRVDQQIFSFSVKLDGIVSEEENIFFK